MSETTTHAHVLAFDIYGTLLNTGSVSDALQQFVDLEPSKAREVSDNWRRYQLEYTWRMNSMDVYEPFDVVTRKSLLHAVAESQLVLDDHVIQKLMDAYNHLQSFSDAGPALQCLTTPYANAVSIKVLVFSNGTEQMVQEALKAGSLQSFPAGIFVADSVRKYKPAPEMYRGLLDYAGKKASPDRCWLVSGNPFDVTGAHAQGLNTIWVDRAGKGWSDRLGGRPTKIVHGLGEIVEFMQSLDHQE